MSVIDVKELHQRRRSSWKDGTLSHTRTFLVVCDDPRDGTRTAIVGASPSFVTMDDPTFADLTDEEFATLLATSTLAIPVPGSEFPYNSTCRVVGVSAEPVKESDVVHEVTVEYENASAAEAAVHPLERPAKFTYGAAEYTLPYFIDESAPARRPFVNSAGDPFEQTWEREDADLTVTMVRNEASYNVLAADAIKNTTNNAVVTLDGQQYAPDTLRMTLPTATKQSEVWLGETVDYYEVTRVFKAKKDGWTDRPLDYGYSELRDVPGPSGTTVKQRFPIMDAAGKTQRPWPLDGQAKALPSPSGAAATLTFRPYRAASWASLNLA